MTEPNKVTAGDTITWARSVPDYPASAGWTLKYAIRGPADINITAAADGDDYAISVTAAASGGWTAGNYWWTAYVEKGSDRHTVATGQIVIAANLTGTVGTYDGRSQVKKTLDALESLLLGKSTAGDISNITIMGNAVTRMSADELIKWRTHFSQLYAQEQAAEKLAKGENLGGRILTRFT